ncbi:hypothetical protein [Sediminitomix flava]|uniref:Lipoprotein n=1 Tax=Sediminitomix flava TaxID=379075 RepID=A0A315ZDT4_SEDFL|nr:hypothetical protein [Sediminitomix flava]PWJ43701.1 hypothetical protein BC781_10147 [Sediminitomix flava]
MRFLLFFIVSSFFLTSCGSNNNTRFKFEGFTYRDPVGNILSIDPTDWNFTDNWNSQEHALFEESKQTCILNNDMLRILAFPNPIVSDFNLQIDKNNESLFSYRVVDQNFNLYFSGDSITDQSIRFKLKENIDVKGNILRVYYKVIEENCEYIGHGDIEIYPY